MSILGFTFRYMSSETTGLFSALIKWACMTLNYIRTFLSCLSAGPILWCSCRLSRCTINCHLDATGHNLPLRCGLHPGGERQYSKSDWNASRVAALLIEGVLFSTHTHKLHLNVSLYFQGWHWHLKLETQQSSQLLCVKAETHQRAVQRSLRCTVNEHCASGCAHRQQVRIFLHLSHLRFPLLPLRSLLKHDTFMIRLKKKHRDITCKPQPIEQLCVVLNHAAGLITENL